MSQLQVNRGEVTVAGIEGKKELMEAFLASLDVKEATRTTYRWGMVRFFSWVERSGLDLGRMIPADLVRYKTSLLGTGLSPLTVGLYLVVVHQFYRWTEVNMLFPNISRSVKSPRNKVGVRKMHLTEEEVVRLLDYAKGRSLRDWAMFNLIIRTGLRTIEVSRANVADITHRKGRRILRVWGKGRDDRSSFVILNAPAWLPLKEYLSSRTDCRKEDPLFVTDGKGHRGRRMSPRVVQMACKEALRGIGLDSHEYSAHSLRHTTAVHILKRGGDWKDVQRVLRHISPSTSQIYTMSIEEEVRLQRNPEALLDDAFTED